MAEISSQSGQWKSSLDAVSSGISGLGIEAEPVQKMLAVLNVFNGLASAGAAVQALIEMYHIAATAEAVTETAVRTAQGPPGWALIALALGTAVGAGAVIYGVARQMDINANLDNPSESKLASMTAVRT